jgi:hypothetical protein
VREKKIKIGGWRRKKWRRKKRRMENGGFLSDENSNFTLLNF